MAFSLPVRVGGLINLFRMPKNYKNLFEKMFENKIQNDRLIGNNKRSRPSYFSLFRTQTFYNSLRNFLLKEENRPLLTFYQNELGIVIPDSFEKFLELSSPEVERLGGIAEMMARIKSDGVCFSTLKQ